MLKCLFYGLAVLIFMYGQFSFSQEKEKKELTSEQKEIVELKLDLLASQRATLEENSERLKLLSDLLQLKSAIWLDSRDKAQLEVNALFGCNYDLDKRTCKSEPKK